jgi:hypothetical protein
VTHPINRATAVGREIPEPTPAFSFDTVSFTDAFRSCPLDLQCLASLKSGAHEGLAMDAGLEAGAVVAQVAYGYNFGLSGRAKLGCGYGSRRATQKSTNEGRAVFDGYGGCKRKPPGRFRAGAC